MGKKLYHLFMGYAYDAGGGVFDLELSSTDIEEIKKYVRIHYQQNPEPSHYEWFQITDEEMNLLYYYTYYGDEENQQSVEIKYDEKVHRCTFVDFEGATHNHDKTNDS